MDILKKHKYLIKSVAIGDDKIYVELYPYKIITIPFDYTEKLSKATPEQLRNYRIIGKGIGIHFEEIDEDLSVDGIVKDFIEKYKKVSITLPVNLLEKLDKYAMKKNISRSLLIQKAIEKLDNLEI